MFVLGKTARQGTATDDRAYLHICKNISEKMYVTHHGETWEQSWRPAGGFKLGPAQVKLSPGQGLHRVVVGGDQLQVTAPHPVSVVHPPAILNPLWVPWGGGAHGHIQLTAHGNWWTTEKEKVIF